jgi:hypothetical protein
VKDNDTLTERSVMVVLNDGTKMTFPRVQFNVGGSFAFDIESELVISLQGSVLSLDASHTLYTIQLP